MINAQYTEFRLSDGRVSCRIDVVPVGARSTPETVIFDGDWPGDEWFYKDGEIVPRPRLTPSDRLEFAFASSAVLTLEDVPAGTLVQVAGEWHEVDDGSLSLQFSLVGEHAVRLMPPFPFRHQTIGVTVHAA